MEDKRKKVYDVLVKQTGYGDSYEKFDEFMNEPSKRKKVYDVLVKQTGYGDSYEEFDKFMNEPSNTPTQQVATTPTNKSETPTTSVASTVQEASPSAEVATQPTNVVEAAKVSNATNTQPTKVYKPVDYPWDDEQPTNDGVFYRASPQVQAQVQSQQSQQTQSKVAPPPQGTTPVAQAPTTPVAQAPTTGKKSSGGGTQNDEFEESLEQLRSQFGESSLDNPWEYHKKWDEIRRGAYVKEVDEMLQSILDSDMPINDADLVSLTSMFNGENSSQSIAAFNKYATPEQKERFQALEKWREQDALTEKKINAVIDQNPDLFLLLNPKGWDIDAVKRYIADQLVYGEYNNELLWYAGEGSEIPNQEQLAKYIISQELEIASRYGNAAHKAFMDNSFDSEATQQLFNAALWAEKNWGYATKVNFPEPFRRMYETYVGDAAERGELGTEEFEARVNDAFAKLDTYMGIMEEMSAEEREKYLPENWVEEIFTPYSATRSSEDKAAEYVASKNLLDDTGKFLTEAENLRREYMKKGRDEYAANTSAIELAFDATVGSLESINPATNKFTSGNYKYSYEISLLDDITDMLEETEDLRKHKSRDDSFLSGLWHGFTDKATNFDTWDFGVDNFMEALTLKRLVEKSDRGESLTREEQMFLDAVATGMAAQYLIEPGRGYKAGMTTAEALPFMLEMIFSPIKGGSSAASKFARWAIKRYGLGGAKKLLPTTARYAIRGAGDIGKSVLTATTTGSFRTGQNALNRNIGEITPTTNDAGNVVYGGHEEGESTGKAITKAIGSTAIEYHSELVGEYFAPFLRGLSKLTDKGMSKIGLGSVTKFFKDVKSSDWAKLVGEMRKKASLQTTPGEFLEEIVGGIENAILVGEQTLDTEKDTGVFNTDNLIDTYLGVQVMGTMMTSVQSIGYKSESKRTELMRDNWSKQGEVLLGKNWGDIRAKIDGATMNDLSTIVTDIIADPKYSANQKKVVLRYAGAMAQDQALLSAEEQREMDYQGERVIDAQGWVDEGYNEGYDATSAESRRAVAEQDQDARKAVIDLLGLPEDAKVAEVIQQRYDSKNLRTISTKIIDDSDLNRAQKDIMLNYVASQKRIQGMQKRHADEVEMAVDYFGAVVDGNSNKQTSQLVIGTLKDGEREVYIVDGEVQLLDDGTIDVANSTESLFVRDVDTGETESISAGELMGIEVQDPAEVKAQISSDIKTRMQQEYDASFDAVEESSAPFESNEVVGANEEAVDSHNESAPTAAVEVGGASTATEVEATDTPAYKLNDEVRVVDNEGNELTGVVIEEENADGEVLVEVGGRVLPIQREALDAMNSQSEAGSSAEVDSQEGEDNSQQEGDVAEESTERPMEISPGVAVRVGGVAGVATSFPEDGKVIVETEDGKILPYDESEVEVVGETTEPTGTTETTMSDGPNESDGTNRPNDAKESQSTASPLGAIPVDAKGEPMYESAPVEATIADIYNDPDLEEEEADAFVQAKIDGATKRIADLENKKPKMGESKVAFKEEKAKWREQLEAEQSSLAYWQGVQEARAKESTTSPLQGTPPISQSETRGELDANGEMGEIGEISAEAEGAIDEDNGEGKKMSVEEARAKAKAEREAREKAREKAKAAGKRAEERARNRGDYRKAMAQWEDAPGSFYEYVAQALLVGNHKMRWNDNGSTRGLGSHTTGRRGVNRRGEVVTARNDESRAMGWLIDDRGGLSPEALADKLWNEYTGSYGEEMGEGSPLDVLLDVVTSMPTPQMMWDYVKGEHDARMEAEQGTYEEQYSAEEIEAFERDAMYREKYGVSEEEYWANEAQWDEFIESREMSAEELGNYDNFVAEERIKEEHGRRNQENAEDEQRTDNSESEGGVEVLSGTQPDITRGNEDVAGESEGVDGNGVESNDVASEEAAELSEEDRQAIENMPIPTLKRQIKDTATTLFNVSQTSDQWQAENKDKIERANRESIERRSLKDDFFSDNTSPRDYKQVDSSLEKGKTYSIDKVKELFYKYNTNEEQRKLADRVFEVASNLGIKVDFLRDDLGFGLGGRVSGDVMEIARITTLERNIDKLPDVLLHESIHAVTVYAMDAYTNRELTNPILKEAVEEIKEVYKQISSNESLKGEYGLKNEKELVAEMANPKFRNKLKAINLWDKLKDAIKKIFLGRSSISADEVLSDALDKILDNFDINLYEEYSRTQEIDNSNWDFVELGQSTDIEKGLLFRDGEVFYSNAEEAVRNIKQEKATPEQWLAMTQKNGGLKAGEDKWLGLSDWLKASDSKTLTKQEVLEFIAQNKIVIEEVGYGGDSIASAQSEFDELTEELGGYDEAFEEMVNRYGDDFREAVWYDEVGQLHLEEGYEDYGDILGGERGINPTRMSFTTEGLENNKEIALVVPSVDPYNAHDEIHFGDAGEGRAVAWVRFGETTAYDEVVDIQEVTEFHEPFKDVAGHDIYKPIGGFRSGDYVAHGKARNGGMIYVVYINDKQIPVAHNSLEEAQKAMNEYYKEHPRVLKRPKRVLVIDEIQSKRHQDGREKGYRGKDVAQREARIAEIKGRLRVISDRRSEISDLIPRDIKGLLNRANYRKTMPENDEFERLRDEEIALRGELDEITLSMSERNAVPDAPFEKNWHELVMKRMLRYAAENGFDKVAWTTGAQQAERYDIGKVIDQVERDDDGVLVRTYNGDISIDFDENGKITSGQYAGNTLAEVFGKELATKIMSMESGEVLEEDGLRLGGDGMKGFYDKMLPSFMNKYGKKWGVKVGEVTMPNIGDGGLTMHSVDVTDAMRESVMEGQPMFREGDGEMNDAEVSMANDPIAKVMGRSQRSKKQQAKFAERVRKAMRNRVAELAEKMHLDNVEVVESSLSTPSPSSTPQSQSTPSPFRGTPPKQGSRGELNASNGGVMSERKARAKGWFDTRTGKIVINISNHTSVADVERTLLHEAVAHYGLRQLFGKQFDTFLDNVYRFAEADIRAQIVELAKKHGWDFRTATEEYLAGLAEDTNFEYLEHNWSWWQKIKQLFMDMLESIGWRYQGPELSDNELRYLLWRSYENMVNPGRHRSILGMAEDAVRRAKFGIGEYSVDSPAPSQVAESGEMYSDGDVPTSDEIVSNYIEQFSGAKDLDITIIDSEEAAIEYAMSLGDSLESAREGVEYVKERGIAGGFEPGTNKIRIFAINGTNNLYATLFHEHAHYAIEKLGGVTQMEALVEELKGLDAKLEHKLKTQYAESEVDEEMITVSLEAALYGNAIEDLKLALSSDARLQIEQILDIIGYEEGRDYKEEVERYELDPTSEEFRKRQTRTRRRIAERKQRREFLGTETWSQGLSEIYGSSGARGQSKEGLSGVVERNTRAEASQGRSRQEEVGDEGVLFRDGDVTVDDLGERDRVIARDAYERMMSQGRYQFTEAMQDSMMGLKLLYKAILGKKMRVEDIPDFENAYVAENLMSSQNAAEQHVYFVKFVKPLLDAVYKLAGSNAERRQRLIDYMMAKHGLERNQVMAERDAKRTADEAVKDIVEEDKKNVKWQEVYNEALKENRRRDYSGLTTLTGKENVAEAEYEAQKMVEEYEKAHGEDNITELWERVNAATKNTLEKLYRSGLMGKEQYEQTDAMYQYYIPLRGWEQTTSDEVYGYLTSKNGPMGSPIKHAKGRTSKADDPIATIGLMADDAIRHGNRNNMKQRFLNFVLNHPSDAVSVSELWLEYNEALDEWVPVFPNIDKDDSAEEIERKTQEFETRMEALANENPDKYKRGKDAANIPYKVVPGNEREHQVLVKRGGRTFVLTINGNPRAAQALNGLTNPDVKADSVVGPMLDWLQAGTRQLSALYTTRNPDFVVSNFLRDMIYSNSMVWIKESPKYAAKFHKNCVVAGTMLPILLTKWERGTLDMRKELEHNFFLFMITGGETGYTEIRDLEKHKRTVVAELKKKGNIGRKAWRALGIVADDANRSIENTARFAAFLTSRSEGRSVQRSAYDAKEISVNFNKKGAGGKFVKANGQTLLGKAGGYMSGYGRLFYAFWNAGMQGMTNFGKAAKRHPFKATFAMALMYALGAWVASLNDDDDDKDKYYLLPEYVRRSNICFRFGDGWVTIPLPIEFRAMYGLGELFTAVASGNEKYTNEELAMAIAGQFSQLLPLDMLEGGGGLNAFTPTIIKPVVEAYRNVGWHGNPIHREFYGDAEKYDPQWTLAYSSTSTFLMDLTKALNEVGGGDNELPTRGNWWTDWNPARMEYMLKGYGGGVYSIVDKLIKSGETVFGDRPYEAKNTPMVNRIYKEDDPEAKQRKINGIYYKALEEAKETEDEVNKMEKKAESDSKYKAKFEAFKKSDEYKKYVFVIGYKDAIDEINKRLKYKDIEVPAEELDAQILMLKQELAEGIWSFETQTTSAIERQNELRELQIQEKYIDLDKKQQAAKDSIKIEEKKASGASAKEIHKTKSRAKGNLKRKDTDLKKAKKAFEEKYGEE